jgi:hypothetical protein
MKRVFSFMLVAIIGMLLVSLTAGQASAWVQDDDHAFLHKFWEGNHATMINALLITANDAIVKHHERYVMLAQEYSERDPLINVYGLRERYDDDSDKDAFLVGLKANNLIYLIYVADDNPVARKLAIKELRLLGKNVQNTMVKREFPYWADLLEEGRFPSKRLAHMYVQYTIEVGNYYADRVDINKRFFYWMGFLINDFTVANLCNNEEWMMEDQKLLQNLYSVRIFGKLPNTVEKEWYKSGVADLTLKDAIDKTQKQLDDIKSRWTDRKMGK